MTTTTATEHDHRGVVRALWALYLGCLALVAACFVGLVVTGQGTYLAAGLLTCVCGWIVTGPLEDARREARIIPPGQAVNGLDWDGWDGLVSEVREIPDCDIHSQILGVPGVPAAYDGAMKSGPWAFMCADCFAQHGVGLGLGVGQQLRQEVTP